MTEEFRPVKDFERYYVSNFGRVLNTETGRYINIREDRYGYLTVQLWKHGKGKDCKVHRLVANAFIPNPDNLDTADHLNGIKTDNRIENLQWLSRSENTKRFHREQATEEWKNHNKEVMRNIYKEGVRKTTEVCSKPVICIETGIVYKSSVDAERKLNFGHGCIGGVVKGKYKQTHGLHFKYLLE